MWWGCGKVHTEQTRFKGNMQLYLETRGQPCQSVVAVTAGPGSSPWKALHQMPLAVSQIHDASTGGSLMDTPSVMTMTHP